MLNRIAAIAFSDETIEQNGLVRPLVKDADRLKALGQLAQLSGMAVQKVEHTGEGKHTGKVDMLRVAAESWK